MFFSILIPVYNEEEYLQDCIESLLSQDIKDFEIILVDDGSVDKSPQLCDVYAEKYDFIRVIHKQNEGLFKARKTGIINALGDYLLFVDSDDKLREDALPMIRNTVIKTNCDIVLFNASTSIDFKQRLLDIPFRNEQFFSENNKSELLQIVCSTHKLNNLCFKCVKRSLFKMDDYVLETKLNYGEDMYQSLPVLDRALRIVYLDENFYFYRQRGNSLTHMYSQEQLESINIVFLRLLYYAKKWSNEYQVNYVDLTDKYSGQECYTIAKNVISSKMSFKKKKISYKAVFESEFYNLHRKKAYKEVGLSRRILLRMINTKCVFVWYILHLLFKMK